MSEISVALEMPIELGRSVVSSPVVRSSVDSSPYARIASRPSLPDSEITYRGLGPTMLSVLGAPSTVAAVTGLFAVIRTTIKEAHRTIRERQSQQHDLQKIALVLGANREEIDLSIDLQQIEARVDKLQQQATEHLSQEAK